MDKVYIILINTRSDDGPITTEIHEQFFLTEESAHEYITTKWPSYNTYVEYLSKMYEILEERCGKHWDYDNYMEVRSQLIEESNLDIEELEECWEDTSIDVKELVLCKDR